MRGSWNNSVYMLPHADAVDCTDGEMRLVSASGETEGVRNGRLEICYQGVWGAVYDTDWSAIDAAVTCQQLGFDQRGITSIIGSVHNIIKSNGAQIVW